MTGTITMTRDQYVPFANAITATGGSDSVTLTTTGTATMNAALESMTASNAGNAITAVVGTASTITGGSGDDTINIAVGAAASAAIHNVVLTSGGNDTVNLGSTVLAAGRTIITGFTAGVATGRDIINYGTTTTGTNDYATATSIQAHTTAGNLTGAAGSEIIRVTSGTLANNLTTTTAAGDLIGTNVLLAIGGTFTGAVTGANMNLILIGDDFGNTGIYQATSADNAIVAAEIVLVGVLSGTSVGNLAVSNFTNV